MSFNKWKVRHDESEFAANRWRWSRETERVLWHTNCHLNTLSTLSLPPLVSPHSLGLKFYLFIHLAVPGLHCSVQDLLVVAHGINFPTRDGIQASCTGVWGLLLDHQGSSCLDSLNSAARWIFHLDIQWAPQTYGPKPKPCFLLLALLLAQWITKEKLRSLLRACRDLGDRWRLVASPGGVPYARRTNTFKILSWPKRLFGLFHMMLWKNPDEVFDQPNV